MPLATKDQGLPDDQLMLIDAARDFAQQELVGLDRASDKDESSLFSIAHTLGDMGLMSLAVPEELGGLGCPYRTYAAIIYDLAAASASTAVMVAVHNMVGKIVAKYAPEPLRSQWLSQWSEPNSFAAFALSEANAGSDAAAVSTTVVEKNGAFSLTGEKMWITNGMHAGWFLTLARLKDAPKDKSLCTFMVEGSRPGIERTHIRGKLGIRGSETAVIHFEDVVVPADHMLGEPGEGLNVALSSLNEGRIGIASQAGGIAEACLTEMVAYAKQREQFGRPIGKFQAVADMIATSAVELEAAKALIWRAACYVDSDRSDVAASSMAKLYASEAANRIAYRALQVHGGSGYVNECRVEQLFRDARVTTIYEGTSEVQRILIARELSGRS